VGGEHIREGIRPQFPGKASLKDSERVGNWSTGNHQELVRIRSGTWSLVAEQGGLPILVAGKRDLSRIECATCLSKILTGALNQGGRK